MTSTFVVHNKLMNVEYKDDKKDRTAHFNSQGVHRNNIFVSETNQHYIYKKEEYKKWGFNQSETVFTFVTFKSQSVVNARPHLGENHHLSKLVVHQAVRENHHSYWNIDQNEHPQVSVKTRFLILQDFKAKNPIISAN